MVSYTVHGRVLEFRASGPYSSEEWDKAYTAARNDPAVPDGALLLINIRETDIIFSGVQMLGRVMNLREKLGPKLGKACAFLPSSGGQVSSIDFRVFAATELGLRAAVFADPAAARQWLGSFEAPGV